MPRRHPGDKPIRPWADALADTWIFPALTAGFAGAYWWPGGDLVLLAMVTLFGLCSVLALAAAYRLHRRRARWQRLGADAAAAWRRCRGQADAARNQEQERRYQEWQRRALQNQDDDFSLE